MKHKAIAFATFISLGYIASAQNKSVKEDTDSLDDDRWSKILDEVVVTGTMTPKLISDSPILTRVISTGDIRKSDATNISDLL
ncbi:MAG: TonB-dependent receptor, partial [Paramuribaculum sp.]|nr:TonB-dependent receptor [Paramuribaculum sp.]